MLMCGKHWRLVPKMLQDEVWATYVPGQERSKTPTAEYLIAAEDAVLHVALQEGLLSGVEAKEHSDRFRREAYRHAELFRLLFGEDD